MRTTMLSTSLSVFAAGLCAEPLTVYTYDAFANEWGPGPALAEAFADYCEGCEVAFMGAADSGAILSRIRLEGASTPADVVLGIDQNLMPGAHESGLFIPHNVTLPETSALIGSWEDETFMPFDVGVLAFCYDKDVVSTPPSSLAELAASDLQILIQDPRASTPGLMLVTWVENIYGADAAEYWQSLSDNIVTVSPGWSEAYSLFLQGEADMVLSYTTSPAYHAIEEDDDSYAAAIFTDGLPLQIEVAAILESTDQPDLAKEFMAFMTTPAAQALLPTGNWAYPAYNVGAEIPASFTPVDQIDPLRLPPPSDEAITIWADNIGS